MPPGATLLGPTTPPPPRPPVAPEDRTKVRTWMETVALGTEFGRREERVVRWTKPIRLSVMQGDQAVRRDLIELVPLLNETLGPAGAGITVVGDRDSRASMQVHFAPLDQFDAIARQNGFTYVRGNHGYFHLFWTPRWEIYRAVVLLATDKLSGTSLRHFTFEEITQALGLANDSPLFPDSIFYARGADGGGVTNLSPLDRKLVGFLYTRLSPGDDRRKLRAAFDAHWR